MNINFSKATASGNDFVIINNRENIIENASPDFIKLIADRRFGVGADGVILIEKSTEYEFSMKYYNSDGFLGSLCGNGARCTARFIYEFISKRDKIIFEAIGRKYMAEVDKNIVKLFFPDIVLDNKFLDIKISDRIIHSGFIDTGSPHAVILINDLSKDLSLSELDVYKFGKEIRYSEAFKPNGTNVNFIEPIPNHGVKIRTYERGVEDETLACGSGSVASALIAYLSGKTDVPVEIHTQGGDLFYVGFRIENLIAKDLYLQGPANIVFNGIFNFDFKQNRISAIS